MKHISPTFMYIIPMYLRLTTFTKKPPPNVISPIFFAIFISLCGSTHDSAGAFTDPRLPATASNVCTTDARLGGVGRVAPSNKNPGYAGVPPMCRVPTVMGNPGKKSWYGKSWKSHGKWAKKIKSWKLKKVMEFLHCLSQITHEKF